MRKARSSRLKILSPIGLSRGGGKAGGAPLTLVEDAFGFEQQGLAEFLGADDDDDDDELVVAVRAQKTFDFGGAMQRGFVEILRHLDVVRIHGPGTHAVLPCNTKRPKG